MEVSDVKTLLTILAKQSSERQQQLKKWMMILGASLVLVIIVTTLTLGTIIWKQAKSLENVTSTLERRDPTGDDPDEQQQTLIAAVKENYLLKEQLYIATAESSPTCVVHD